MTQMIRFSGIVSTALRSSSSSTIWTMVLFCLAMMISVELFQHGNTIFGSFFLLENIHKLRHGSLNDGSDHTAHLGGYH